MWTSNSRLAGANRRIGYKSFQLLAYSLQLCSTLDSYGIPEIAYPHFQDSINAAQSSNIKPTTFSKLVKRQMWQRVKCKAEKPREFRASHPMELQIKSYRSLQPPPSAHPTRYQTPNYLAVFTLHL